MGNQMKAVSVRSILALSLETISLPKKNHFKRKIYIFITISLLFNYIITQLE